jgi:hypothetical protein
LIDVLVDVTIDVPVDVSNTNAVQGHFSRIQRGTISVAAGIG